MQAKYYTLDAARAVLPQVKTLMAQVQEARVEILRLRPDMWPVLQKAAGNGGNVAAGQILNHFHKMEEGVKGILGMGILVKDLDTGLVDFLSVRKGREVYLCWKYGEEDLTFWHDINTGYQDRQPIDPNDFPA